MDLRHIENIIKDSESDSAQKKETIISTLQTKCHDDTAIDSGSALQLFLDHITINSIPGIRNSSVLELYSEDCLKEAIKLLYEKNVFGAPITDALEEEPKPELEKFLDRYIGFIDFATMVLWSIEERDKLDPEIKHEVCEGINTNGIFSMLEKIPSIGKTKVGELAKSFLWDPFFPVHLNDTLFQVLLLLSKHQLQVVPVTEGSNVIGFVTKIAIVELLLQSSGLDWFDRISDKALSEFRLENDGRLVYVYGDQTLAEALHCLRENKVDGVPVINRETKTLIGNVRVHDIHLLLDNEKFFRDRRNITVEEFIQSDTRKSELTTDSTLTQNLGGLLSAGALRLRNKFMPTMDSPVTNKKSDTLKQAMKTLVESKNNCSYLVDESRHFIGVVSLRDVIMQFAPPGIDSRIKGGGFFQSALEQSGCHLNNGSIVHDR
ncbi:hypothetical protein GIB67_005549 [Kingdonia uniflora]|uniref:CBS domain-containing protein n=1 Tax=Kingdonia uniflora TaxID=39325 RepID=A0A7J7NHQ0_9MAGN|nr:hypothetical protein GIB67_005549 [Kingdonia uniflora]